MHLLQTYIYIHINTHMCIHKRTYIYIYALQDMQHLWLSPADSDPFEVLSVGTDGTKDAFAGSIFGRVPSLDTQIRTPQDPSNSRSKSGRWVSFYHSLECFFLLGISRFLKDFGKNSGPGFQRPDFRGQQWANPCQNPFKWCWNNMKQVELLWVGRMTMDMQLHVSYNIHIDIYIRSIFLKSRNDLTQIHLIPAFELWAFLRIGVPIIGMRNCTKPNSHSLR